MTEPVIERGRHLSAMAMTRLCLASADKVLDRIAAMRIDAATRIAGSRIVEALQDYGAPSALGSLRLIFGRKNRLPAQGTSQRKRLAEMRGWYRPW